MARTEKYNASEENREPVGTATKRALAETAPTQAPAPNPTVKLGDRDPNAPISVADGETYVVRIPHDVGLTHVPAHMSKYNRDSWIAEECAIREGRDFRAARIWVSLALKISLGEVMKDAKKARVLRITRDPSAPRDAQYDVRVVE